MRDTSHIVPFPRFFAVVGYAFAVLLVLAAAAELLARAALAVHRSRQAAFAFLPAEDRAHFRSCYGTGTGNCLDRPQNFELEVMSASPVYAGEPWAEEFWRANRARFVLPKLYEPYVEWRNRGWESAHLNVDHTPLGWIRRTVPAAPCPGKPLRAWMFGGSTVFGEGSPDASTIASQLSARLSAAAGRCVEVVNLGVEGYTSDQEVVLLGQLLKTQPAPDLVIFYDGANDTMVGVWDPGVPGSHAAVAGMRERLEGDPPPRWLARSAALHVARGLMRRASPPSQPGAADWSDAALAARVRATLDRYQANVRQVRALAQAYGFRAYFFWHPVLLYGEKPPAPFEALFTRYPELGAMGYGREGGERFSAALRATYAEAERRAPSGGYVFLGRLFDGNSAPLYIDPLHLGPAGDALVADALAGEIAPGLRSEAVSPGRRTPSR